MSHYYDEQPDVASDIQTFDYHYDDQSITLQTDAGVFSKGKIDFGSDLLVRTFLKQNPPGPVKTIADVGCGYGPIGLMIGKMEPHNHVDMLDVNLRALKLARHNAKSNHIDNVSVIESDGFDQVDEQQYDYVLTNPPIRAGKETVHRIFEEAHQHLKKNGTLYVVIQKKQGMPSAKEKMRALFDNVEVLEKSKGYYILRSSKG
ncbi:class I SAM-dependent methyltransferase [Staphylococcus auricularis]|uniref:class I SAM-dependent methyltransferase n=1 Tax=Staphylococcus auricularis TaxID=29379 RepID=UPI001F1BB753|nr:class I SAM-dependent methyltransferase [Staphylococcus auricularis]MCE5038455.1 class I SAM-dependent methyltransferase [Staphylococcus auricularis]